MSDEKIICNDIDDNQRCADKLCQHPFGNHDNRRKLGPDAYGSGGACLVDDCPCKYFVFEGLAAVLRHEQTSSPEVLAVTMRDLIVELSFDPKGLTDNTTKLIKKVVSARGAYVETRDSGYLVIVAKIDGRIHRATIWKPTAVVTAFDVPPKEAGD